MLLLTVSQRIWFGARRVCVSGDTEAGRARVVGERLVEERVARVGEWVACCGLRVVGCVIVDAISWKNEPPATVMSATMSQTNGAKARRMVRMPLAFGVACFAAQLPFLLRSFGTTADMPA